MSREMVCRSWNSDMLIVILEKIRQTCGLRKRLHLQSSRLVIEQEARERFAKLGLANAGGPKEQERGHGPVRWLKTCS
jgi:hypothetical protein